MATEFSQGAAVRVADYAGRMIKSGVYVRSYEVNGVPFSVVKPSEDSPHCDQYAVETYRVRSCAND